jgi:hypothetical protein
MTDRHPDKVQQEVVNELLQFGAKDAVIEEKYRLAPGTIEAWLDDDEFTSLLRRRMKISAWRFKIAVARSAVIAADELATMLQSKSDETRRKVSQNLVARRMNMLT